MGAALADGAHLAPAAPQRRLSTLDSALQSEITRLATPQAPDGETSSSAETSQRLPWAADG